MFIKIILKSFYLTILHRALGTPYSGGARQSLRGPQSFLFIKGHLDAHLIKIITDALKFFFGKTLKSRFKFQSSSTITNSVYFTGKGMIYKITN